MIISITGTPGTGKTTVSRIVARSLGARLVHLNNFIRKNRLYQDLDKKSKAMIVETKIMKNAFAKSRSQWKDNNILVEGHLAHFIDSDIVFVLRLDPKELEKRLKRKGFSRRKIVENLQAEILDVIYAEALTGCKNVVQIDATNKSPGTVAKRILNTFFSKKYRSDKVDWTKKYQDCLTENY